MPTSTHIHVIYSYTVFIGSGIKGHKQETQTHCPLKSRVANHLCQRTGLHGKVCSDRRISRRSCLPVPQIVLGVGHLRCIHLNIFCRSLSLVPPFSVYIYMMTMISALAMSSSNREALDLCTRSPGLMLVQRRARTPNCQPNMGDPPLALDCGSPSLTPYKQFLQDLAGYPMRPCESGGL